MNIKKHIIRLARKLPVWGVVYRENHVYDGEAYRHYGKMTLKEAMVLRRLLTKKRMRFIEDVAVVLDIQDQL